MWSFRRDFGLPCRLEIHAARGTPFLAMISELSTATSGAVSFGKEGLQASTAHVTPVNI